jgi:hypothetical protein
MCVTCLFGVHDLSLLSTKHVALRTSYNIEIAQHKYTIPIATKIKQDKQMKRVGSTFWISYNYVIREIWQEACGLQDMDLGVSMARSKDLRELDYPGYD